MLLSDDSPILAPSPSEDLEPLPRINLETCLEATATEDLGVCATKIEITFDRPGSLGIEFCELKSPFLVQEVHSHGLAYGQDLQKGDLLLTAGGQAVDGLPWDTLVGLLTQRPVSVTFKREPARGTTDHAGSAAALLTGFTSNLWQLGGTVAQQGLDIGSKVSSVGLDLGVKGLDFGNVGFDLGGKVTSSFVGGLVGSVQDTSGGEASPDTSTLALDFAPSPSTDDDTVMVEAASASVISLSEESPVGGMVANGHGSSNGHGQAEVGTSSASQSVKLNFAFRAACAGDQRQVFGKFHLGPAIPGRRSGLQADLGSWRKNPRLATVVLGGLLSSSSSDKEPSSQKETRLQDGRSAERPEMTMELGGAFSERARFRSCLVLVGYCRSGAAFSLATAVEEAPVTRARGTVICGAHVVGKGRAQDDRKQLPGDSVLEQILPDVVSYNAAMDAVSGMGVGYALFRKAFGLGMYPQFWSNSYSTINLHDMSCGAAVLAVRRWLAEVVPHLLSGPTTPKLEVITGWGKSRKDWRTTTDVQDAVFQLLQGYQFPSRIDQNNRGVITIDGRQLKSSELRRLFTPPS
ncbi:unnamed protein product [Polarella glacialis]|uniref:Smr domain-containing protein n=1 Tax=Polarella glacialis TaxID=89957 RepID=A0A813J6U9_POLGL|nr:unnamed protein product [Polarella glacialis]